LTFALAFPDVYEIGMSQSGIPHPVLAAQRPPGHGRRARVLSWPDMADALRRGRRPLTTLESGTPLAELDVVGFSLQYEMTSPTSWRCSTSPVSACVPRSAESAIP